MLATGGSDAVINLWHDSTAADKDEAFRKEVRHYLMLVLKCLVNEIDLTHLHLYK